MQEGAEIVAAEQVRRFWIPAFATEHGIRTALRCLYVGLIGSTENARMLLEHDPGEIEYGSTTGNRLTRDCFYQATRWMSRVKEFAIDESVFRSQILEPSRSTARFLISVRSQIPATTRLRGFVFAKSKPFFDKYYQNEVLDVSMACPELGVVMSLRHTVDNLGKIGYRMYEFDGAQPVPFVNRIHPAAITATESDDILDLSNLQTLKASWADFPVASHSWSFENYSQIHSVQKDHQHLGMSCVLSGKLVSVSPPRITMQGPAGEPAAHELHMTECFVNQFSGDETKIRSLVGKQVKVLAVFWYGYGFSSSLSRLPEVFLMSEAGSSEDSRSEDAIGFVRSRQRVTKEHFLSRFSEKELARLPHEIITRNGNTLEWMLEMASDDRVLRAFLEQNHLLRRVRAVEDSQGSGRIILLKDVLDRNKLRLERLMGITSNDASLTGLLRHLIQSEDIKAPLPHHWVDVFGILGGEDQAIRDKLRWLRDMGFVAKREEGIMATSRGREVWYSANRENLLSAIERFLLGRVGSFDQLQIRGSVDFPPSLIVRGLNELEQAGRLKCFEVSGERFEILWLIPGKVQEDQKRGPESTPMLSETLSILLSVSYALSTRWILERLKQKNSNWNDESLHSVLTYLRLRGVIRNEMEPSGNEMWIYPWGRRIRDILASRPSEAFTIGELLELAHIPPSEVGKVEQILGTFASQRITTLYDGKYWIIGAPGPEAAEKVVGTQCRKLVKALIRENHGAISEARLIYELNHFLPDRLVATGLRDSDPKKFIENLIKEMIDHKEITKSDRNYEFGPG
jgi:hypothetical protein